MKAIITGVTGIVGEGGLFECLEIQVYKKLASYNRRVIVYFVSGSGADNSKILINWQNDNQ